MQLARRIAPASVPVFEPANASTAPLWAALDFPLLALEALSIGPEECAVVTESTRRGAVVYRASPAAQALGIGPGLGVNAAMALCTGLHNHPRDVQAERRQVQRLHRRLARFTPTIHYQPPATLVLEIAASLKLFGGIDGLCDQLRRDLDESGHQYHLAVTPTPAASVALARAGRQTRLAGKAGLRACLGGLPIRSLDLPVETQRGLKALGVASLRELWRLPRHDLARRFGPHLLRQMDHLLGLHPDPRRTDSLPREFELRQGLDTETEAGDAIVSVTRSLLERLMRFLKSTDALVGSIRISLFHTGRPPSRLVVGARLPHRDLEQWLRLVREHVERYSLDAAVVGVGIACDQFQSGRPTTGDLFDGEDHARQWARSLDELEARLGRHRLWMPALAADYRPELACRRLGEGDATPSPAVRDVHRPLWLLHRPKPLRSSAGCVWFAGRLEILEGPERIESGWWDGGECCRDYYTAASPRHERLWIFQDLKQKDRWYLHGVFG